MGEMTVLVQVEEYITYLLQCYIETGTFWPESKSSI